MSSADAVARIGNVELVTNIFGQWPTFHDAEVVRFTLNREGADGAEIVAGLHTFVMTSTVNQKGFYVLTNHTLVTMRFSGISELELSDFNEQNALFGLEITNAPGSSFKVEFNPSHGLGGSFRCKKLEVISAEPFTPPARMLENTQA